jgi:hypothetical protein
MDKMIVPPWLVKGIWIEFAFCVGRIVDIAVSVERVMVLVESPKGIWRNHPAEWLEYKPDAIKPASPERIARDFDLYRTHVSEMLRALDSLQEQALAAVYPEAAQ